MYHEIASEQDKPQPLVLKENKKANFAVIFIDIFLLYVMNNLVSNIPHPLDQYASKDYPGLIESIINSAANFQVSFLTHDFISCLWAINLALGLGMMGNFVFLLYRPNWFRHLLQAAMSATGFLAVFLVFRLFPFDISSAILQTVTRTLLIILMAALGISLIIELVKFVKNPISVGKNRSRESDGPSQT